MPILIGGSGSTGSTVLRTVLNRHPALFSGYELNFFNKEQVFDEWERARRLVFGTRLHPPFATLGWFAWPGENLTHEDYGWSMPEVREIMEGTSSVAEFAGEYFDRPLKREGARDWVEKTPSNAYSFPQFLREFPQGKVVHTTRAPLASVASLVHRGMDPVYAAGIWLYNTAAAMTVHEDPRSFLVRYEDFTGDPDATVGELCSFMGVPFRSDILEPQEDPDEEERLRNPGWTRSRIAPIKRSPSRFPTLDAAIRRRIRAALTILRVSDSHATRKGMTLRSWGDIAPRIGYDFEPLESLSRRDVRVVRTALLRDRWTRIRHRYPTGLRYYPLEVATS